eukprot:1140041-Pelagomonas_calceolata.AAC.1
MRTPCSTSARAGKTIPWHSQPVGLNRPFSDWQEGGLACPVENTKVGPGRPAKVSYYIHPDLNWGPTAC